MAVLSENKMFILAKGLARGTEVKGGKTSSKYKGVYLRYEDAVETYASREIALSALNSLRAWGYIGLTGTPGIFSILNAPPECHEMAKNLRKSLFGKPSGD